MKASPAKRIIALILTAAMIVTLQPVVPVQAGGDPMDTYFFAPDDYNDPLSEITLDSSGTARFSVSMDTGDISLSFPGDLDRVEMHHLGGSSAYYVLYENGVGKYGAVCDNAAFLTGVEIPDMEPGSYDFMIETKKDGEYYKAFLDEDAVEIVSSGQTSDKPVITTSSLASGVVGTAYSATFEATSETPVTWSIEGGSLPAGLTLNSATGEISGTPTSSGTFFFNIKAENDSGSRTKNNLFINIEAQPITASYTVRYYLNGGKAAEGISPDVYNPQTLDSGTEIILPPAPVYAGYEFAGWRYNNADYKAGDTFTVNSNTNFSAIWKERTVTVKMPRNMEPVIGSVWLQGRNNNDERKYIWSSYYRESDNLSEPGEIELNAGFLEDQDFTELELCAYVNRKETVLASAEIPDNTDNGIQLEASGVSYRFVAGIRAEGLSDSDYYSSQVLNAEHDYVYVPSLIGTETANSYTVKLGFYPGSDAYYEYDWTKEYSAVLDGSYLVVKPDRLPGPSATVSGTVTMGTDNSPLKNVTVTANQYYMGTNRIQSSSTDENGRYTITLYPGADVSFRAVYNGEELYASKGTYINGSDINEGANTENNIIISHSRLFADVNFTTDSDEDTIRRYFSNFADGNALLLNVSPKGETDTTNKFCPYIYGKKNTFTFSLYNSSTVTDTADCKLSGSFIEETETEVQFENSIGSVTFEPILKPGILVKLSSMTTGSYNLVWYDSSGEYASKTNGFSLSQYPEYYSGMAPNAGSYTLVLVPNAYSSLITDGSKLSDLSEEQIIKQWAVNAESNKITELDGYDVDLVTSGNAVYVTLPNSRLTANKESFSSETELLRFTGRVGLDDGITGGKLNSLDIDTAVGFYKNSAIITCVAINGRSYTPLREDHSVSYFDFSKQQIDLPCDFTVYCRPGDINVDASINVKADVSYEKNNHRGSQLIGEASVSRPGSTIYTPSTYVNKDTVSLSGTSRPGEYLTVYDNGVPVGRTYGGYDWTTQVKLWGTDDKVSTTHEIYTVEDGSGLQSDTITVIHRKDGPQLERSYMNFSSYYGSIASGDSYSFGGQMGNVSFTAEFSNSGELDNMKGWDVPVVFKVYTNDGVIRFLPATKNGDTFTAKAGTLYSAVVRTEVLYTPKMDEHEGNVSDPYLATQAEIDTVKDLSDEIAASIKTEELTMDDWSVSFSGGNPIVTGKVPSDASEGEITEGLSKAVQAFSEYGITLKSVGVKYDNSENTLQWLNRVADTKAADTSGKNEYFSRSVMYSSEADYTNAINAVSGIKDEFPNINIEHMVMNDESFKTDLFVMTDASYNNNDEITGGTYAVTITFLRDSTGDVPVYSSSATALLGGDFTDFVSGGTTVIQSFANKANVVRLFSESAGGSDTAVIARATNFNGNYTESSRYSAESDAEGGIGNISSELGVGSAYMVSLPEGVGKAAGGAMGNLSVIGTGISSYYTIKNTNHRQDVSWKMYDDMLSVRYSPCYDKLNVSQKQLVDSCLEKFDKARHKLSSSDTIVSVTTVMGNTAGMVLNFVPGAQGAGLLVTLGTAAVSNVGGWIVGENYKKMIESYETEYKTIKKIFRAHAARTGDKDCEEGDDGDGKNNNVCNDPSGIIYEGVIENPVEGATATLYYAVDAEGNIVTQDSESVIDRLVPAAEYAGTEKGFKNLIPYESTQITGEDGKYQWGVPEGLWFVTADYAGMHSDSNNDKEAVIDVSGSGLTAGSSQAAKLLPVLPVQLDVNIPIIDDSAPEITGVKYTTDGIYVTYSKYMKEGSGTDSVLNTANYEVKADGSDNNIAAGVDIIEQGQAPSNIDANKTKYTRTVLIKTNSALTEGSNVTLNIDGSVESYAGTPMGAAYTNSGTVEKTTQLGQPVFSVKDMTGKDYLTDEHGNPIEGTIKTGSGLRAVVKRGDAVEINLPAGSPEGTVIYYTTDGSTDFSNLDSDNIKRYERPIPVTNNMEINAAAICAAHENSEVSNAQLTLFGTQSWMVSGKVFTYDGESANGLTLTLKGTDNNYTDTAEIAGGSYVFENVPVGGYALSFAGNNKYKALSENISVTDNNFVQNLTLEEKTGGNRPSGGGGGGGGGSVVNTVNYTLTFNTNGGSAISSITQAANSVIDLGTYKPEREGYSFEGWYSDSELTNSVTSVTLTGNTTVYAKWAADTYSTGFTDVETGAYYEDAVKWAVEKGVTTGTSDTTFSPDDDCTRAQMVTFLWRAAGSPEPASSENPFADVNIDDYYGKAVLWAVEKGITTGTGDGTAFSPNDTVDRGQTVTFIYRAAGQPAVSGSNPFTDVNADMYYANAVNWAVANNITNGVSDTEFAPSQSCTRAQIVTLLYRYYEPLTQ